MNRAIPLCAIALALLGTACATTPQAAVAQAPPRAATGPSIENDHAYMQRVQELALRRGIGITWVNPPVKRRARSGD